MMRFRLAIALTLAAALAGCMNLTENYPLPPIGINASYDLAPGDVIYLATWVSTARSGGTGTYPPLTAQEQIALRTVMPGTALRANEAALIGATLTTIRSERHSGDYARDLRANEAKLWNAFIAGLKIRRNGEGEPELAFNMKDACDALGPKDQALRLYFSPDSGADPCPADEREVRGVQAKAGSLYAVTVTDGNLTGQSYEDSIPASGRVEIYRAGASMRRPKAGEERWTLTEWEYSGICSTTGDENTIAAIRFKGSLFSLRVVGDGRRAVVLDEAGYRRELPPMPGRPLDTITTESLDLLFPGDVESIRWQQPVPTAFMAACKSS